MEQKHLHIISFDVPFPANYGGVIDVFYKIKALHSLGIKIHLHCFEYGRAEALILEKICEKVYYYKRNMNTQFLFNKLPFVIVSRSSEKMMENLLRDTYPILFEGLHSCFYLIDEQLSTRLKIVRMHNIEHEYYRNLQKVEKAFFKKMYFGREAKKLERFEKNLKYADAVAAISSSDFQELSGRYKNVQYIPAFHPYEEVKIKEGNGDFCLYHGNLEVGENNEAAMYLVTQVFSKIKIPLIIAGKKPSSELRSAASNYKNISIMANINTHEIDDLIRNAQVNVLPTFQGTGIKLKLLSALFNGRHCVVNSMMVSNTGLEQLCSIQDTKELMALEIENLFDTPFDMKEKQKREAVMLKGFSNAINAKKIIDLI